MNIPIFLYHSIYKKECFKKQMEYLNACQLKAISVYNFLQNPQKFPDNSVMLTFDDGNMSDFEVAFPILKEYGFTAHFFLVADFIGKQNFMGWDRIGQLHKAGFIIGSHTAFHKDLSRLTDKEVIYELGHSKLLIEDKLGIRLDAISMPHGGYNKRICEIARESGYKAIFISMPTYRIINIDPYVFGRFDMGACADFNKFRNIASNKFYAQRLEFIFYFTKRFVKKLLPNKILFKLQENKGRC